MIHTTIHRRRPPPPDPARSPVEQAAERLMRALYTVRREFSAAERRQIGADVRMLRRAALGERVGCLIQPD
jgi:hypothetical protein